MIIEVITAIKFLVLLLTGILITKLVGDLLGHTLKSKYFLPLIESLGYGEGAIEFFVTAFKYFFYVISFLIAISVFGFAKIISSLIIALVTIGFIALFLLSFKDYIKNAAAGLILARSGEMIKGRKVSFDGIEGEVAKIGLTNTILKDKEGDLIIIPNSELVNKVLKVKR